RRPSLATTAAKNFSRLLRSWVRNSPKLELPGLAASGSDCEAVMVGPFHLRDERGKRLSFYNVLQACLLFVAVYSRRRPCGGPRAPPPRFTGRDSEAAPDRSLPDCRPADPGRRRRD